MPPSVAVKNSTDNTIQMDHAHSHSHHSSKKHKTAKKRELENGEIDHISKKRKKEKHKSKEVDNYDDIVNTSSSKKSKVTKIDATSKSHEKKEQYLYSDDYYDGKDNDPSLPPDPQASFDSYKISPRTVERLNGKGVNYLFPVQYMTFNDIYKGEDVIVQARTGTGKTLAFAIPLTEKLHKHLKDRRTGRPPKVLVLSPTRELAKQIAEDFQLLSDSLDLFCVYGGVNYEPQERAIYHGLDVLVGTPGRILDYVRKGTLELSQLRHVVLDEVDKMLEMGFAESVDEILQAAYSQENKDDWPQTLFFSATVPPWVRQAATKYMRATRKHHDLIGDEYNKTSTTVEHLAIKCHYNDRASTLNAVLQVYSGHHGRAMVFCQTKRAADELAINPEIKQDVHVLHGDVKQDKREMVLKGFRDGKYSCLITTDVAARGLDIPEVDLVVICGPPQDVDSYIHRSGRTGRAGRDGVCICFYKRDEEFRLKTVERVAGIQFKRVGPPTTTDIVKASSNDAARSLIKVPEDTLEHFRDAAEELIEKRGAVDAVAAALAVISGATTITSRSLLTSQEGFTTFHFWTSVEMRGAGYAWRALENQLPPDLKSSIQRMTMCVDKKGCVFDVPNDMADSVKQCWQDDRNSSLEIAKELPELQEYPASDRGFDRGGNSWRGGRGGFRGQGNGNRNFNSAGNRDRIQHNYNTYWKKGER